MACGRPRIHTPPGNYEGTLSGESVLWCRKQIAQTCGHRDQTTDPGALAPSQPVMGQPTPTPAQLRPPGETARGGGDSARGLWAEAGSGPPPKSFPGPQGSDQQKKQKGRTGQHPEGPDSVGQARSPRWQKGLPAPAPSHPSLGRRSWLFVPVTEPDEAEQDRAGQTQGIPATLCTDRPCAQATCPRKPSSQELHRVCFPQSTLPISTISTAKVTSPCRANPHLATPQVTRDKETLSPQSSKGGHGHSTEQPGPPLLLPSPCGLDLCSHGRGDPGTKGRHRPVGSPRAEHAGRPG